MAAGPLNHIVAAGSVADDLGYIALADISHLLDTATNYRIIDGLMVTALAHGFSRSTRPDQRSCSWAGTRQENGSAAAGAEHIPIAERPYIDTEQDEEWSATAKRIAHDWEDLEHELHAAGVSAEEIEADARAPGPRPATTSSQKCASSSASPSATSPQQWEQASPASPRSSTAR